jgi:hypothetical protein
MLSVRTGWRGNKQPVARACRPGCEQLENRLAPAVYLVNTFQDTPLANAANGQDAAGHVSLRSAVMAAGASSQSDTILLGAGVYATPNGPIEVHGDVHIVGRGPGQTVIEAAHRDRVFEVDGGRLDLAELTLDGGSAANLLKGDVQLTNSQITDNDVAAVVDALLAPKEAAPIPRVSVPLPSQSMSPVDFRTADPPKHLVGPGGGSWTIPKDLQESAQESHRSFWRVDADTTPDTPAQDKPDEIKQSRAQLDNELLTSNGSQPDEATKTAMEIVSLAWRRQDTESWAAFVGEPWINGDVARGEPAYALALFFVLGGFSVRDLAIDARATLSLGARTRRQNERRRYRHEPPKQRRRTRGPPKSGCLSTQPKTKNTQGRQRCLPCSFPGHGFMRAGQANRSGTN